MDATAKLIAIILLASFATERIVAAAGYLFEFFRTQSTLTADERRKARLRLVLLILGAAITYAVVRLSGIRILRVLLPEAPPDTLDFWLTWLVVYAGADRVRDFLQGGEETKPDGAPGHDKAPIVRIQIDRDGAVRELSQPG